VSGPSLVLDSAALPWRDTPFPGVRWKKLSFDPASGSSAVLLAFEAGAAYGAHRHPGVEQYLVLEGSIEDGAGSYGRGTFVHHPPGSVHRPSSRQGCLLYVTLERPIELLG
jgi:anti-sigma factor ChrR (cupin superfamily)